MIDGQETGSDSASDRDRRDVLTPGNRFLGRVVACDGTKVVIAAEAQNGETTLTELWSVGRLVSISVGTNRVVALVASMRTATSSWGEAANNVFLVDAELMGEVRMEAEGREIFSAGITRYPFIGAIAHRIRQADLRRIYDSGLPDSCAIGELTQDETIAATIHVPSMLSKHFAVLGSTGVGKSSSVSLLLRKAVEADPKLRVLILDPHNEFAAAFPDKAVTIDTDTLELPFWMMRLEEFAEVIFRGRPAAPEEYDVLREAIPEAKRAFRGGLDGALIRRQAERAGLTADTPVPYRMSDLLAQIDERIGRLEGRADKPALRALKTRLLAALDDPRYRFMFAAGTVEDSLQEILSRIFRLSGDGKPITAFQLAGIPGEVVNAVASVLCRMAFDIGLWSEGAVHVLVLCEEAHRYVPADAALGFLPTRQAIARIAKEGRKYGVSLGIVTQRPSELDQTILSQCSTVFAMRLANLRDQEIIRSAIPTSSSSTTTFLSAIGNGEAIAFGEAVAVPMRMRFTRLPPNRLPRPHQHGEEGWTAEGRPLDVNTIVARMRAVASPDITGFQQRYEAMSERATSEPPGILDRDASSGSQGFEPYSPSMLPGAGMPESRFGNPQADRFNALRRQILSTDSGPDRRPGGGTPRKG
ncbi:ATP-binding protein [Xaviernesmea rhizosphaerae]|uniref:ATP-binding protein n=1 Tax=Xaviernesmea rhizosphaerae TaxID=1672749 RepID=UPI000AA91AA1